MFMAVVKVRRTLCRQNVRGAWDGREPKGCRDDALEPRRAQAMGARTGQVEFSRDAKLGTLNAKVQDSPLPNPRTH
jgi:hypothetical protein